MRLKMENKKLKEVNYEARKKLRYRGIAENRWINGFEKAYNKKPNPESTLVFRTAFNMGWSSKKKEVEDGK